MDNRQTLWEGTSVHIMSTIDTQTWIQAAIVEQVLFEENNKFQYVREDLHIHIDTQSIILTFLVFKIFCQNDTLHSNVNMEVSPNICSQNTFQTIFFVTLNIKAPFVFCKTIAFMCCEKLFSFDNNVLNFMLNCWDMANGKWCSNSHLNDSWTYDNMYTNI